MSQSKADYINVIGAGLAGSEAAYQIAKRGIPVKLYEMRGVKATPQHKTTNFAELVCSNSFRGDSLTNAVGLLKEEMRRLDSIIMRNGEAHRVPAGGAMAVDREGYAEAVTAKAPSKQNQPECFRRRERLSKRRIGKFLPEMPADQCSAPICISAPGKVCRISGNV